MALMVLLPNNYNWLASNIGASKNFPIAAILGQHFSL
jgi:hypothetical protein